MMLSSKSAPLPETSAPPSDAPGVDGSRNADEEDEDDLALKTPGETTMMIDGVFLSESTLSR